MAILFKLISLNYIFLINEF